MERPRKAKDFEIAPDWIEAWPIDGENSRIFSLFYYWPVAVRSDPVLFF